jgi:hypothetical protein
MTFDNFGLYLGGYQLPLGNKAGLWSVIEAFPLNQAPNTLRHGRAHRYTIANSVTDFAKFHRRTFGSAGLSGSIVLHFP